MRLSYDKLIHILIKNNETTSGLVKKDVLTDYSARRIRKDEPVDLEFILRLCEMYNVGIDELVEVIREPVSRE